jgi:hypothetical protein
MRRRAVSASWTRANRVSRAGKVGACEVCHVPGGVEGLKESWCLLELPVAEGLLGAARVGRELSEEGTD